MSKSKYKATPDQTDKTDLEILRLLTPAQRSTLNEEIQEFRTDYTAEDCQYYLTAILWGTISTDNQVMKQPFVLRNCVHFIGRISALLKTLIPPIPEETNGKHKKVQP